MSAPAILDAVYELHAALRQIGVADSGDDFVVLLSHDAGHRLEQWATHNADRLYTMFRTTAAETDCPMREISLLGVTLEWPVRRVALPKSSAQVLMAPVHRANRERAKP